MNTSFEPQILQTILLDLKNAGVTDVVSEFSFNMFEESITPQVVQQQNPVVINKVVQKEKARLENKAQTEVQTTKASAKNLQENVCLINENAEVIIAASVACKINEQPFKNEEEELFSNILKAMNLKYEVVGYLVVEDSVLSIENIEDLSVIIRGKLSNTKAKTIISFGEDIAKCLMGGNVTLTSVRGKGKEVTTIPYVATYSLKSLLKQPILKGLAWEDLQIAMGYIKKVK